MTSTAIEESETHSNNFKGASMKVTAGVTLDSLDMK
jgi:hypothetical protein